MSAPLPGDVAGALLRLALAVTAHTASVSNDMEVLKVLAGQMEDAAERGVNLSSAELGTAARAQRWTVDHAEAPVADLQLDLDAVGEAIAWPPAGVRLAP